MESILTRYYLLKAWLLIIMVTPLLLPITTIFYGRTNWHLYPIFCFFGILYGLVFSLPTFILCCLIYQLIITRLTSTYLIKSLITSLALIGMLTTIYLWYGSLGYSRGNNYMSLSLSVMYSITTIVFGLLTPIKKKRFI
jgi:hypothetical protein